MTKSFKIWIEDKKTFEKVVKQMDNNAVRWFMSGDCASSHHIDRYNFPPTALFVNSDNELSWSNDKLFFKDHKYSEITSEEYLKEEKQMSKDIKVRDIVRVTNWGELYVSDASWLETQYTQGKIPINFVARYAYGDDSNYRNHKYDDNTRYEVLYVSDELESKVLICEEGVIYANIYLLHVDGVELYDKPVEMTISEIEKKLGITNLKIVER